MSNGMDTMGMGEWPVYSTEASWKYSSTVV